MGIKKAEVPDVDYAEVDLDGRKANNVDVAMRIAMKRNGIDGVKVMKRGEHVFLKRVSA